jgi:outer membrane lipoprotein-sorting protein
VNYCLCGLLLLGCVANVLGADAEQGALIRPPGIDQKLWERMVQIDARGGRIKDLKADFTQEKFTPLLKKPLISSGRILIKGAAALWTTERPEATVMRIDEKEVKLLYPKQKVLEIYKTDEKLGSLAASPFPRLGILARHFTFERMPARELLKEVDDEAHLALRMHPVDPELRKHVEEVCVLLEAATGFVLRAQTTDSDGDRIVMSFSKIEVNTGLMDRDLEMHVPAGVTVTRPLEGAGGGPASETGVGKSK